MKRYEERLARDLQTVRDRVSRMASQVEKAIGNAVQALQQRDHNLGAETILGDHLVNRTMREIDQLCHAFIAVHLPSAGHLRTLSALMRVNLGLERIGDYAVTIARVSEQLSAAPGARMAEELDRIASESLTMLSDAIRAFDALDITAAERTAAQEQEIEYDVDTVYAELMGNPDRESVKNCLALYSVLVHLKRVADQAKNLCEETVFAVTGRTKSPKTYNVLFIDEDNSCLSQMAEAIARKNFPGSGNYRSGGRRPAHVLNELMVRFMEDHGYDLSRSETKSLDLSAHDLFEQHVIVSLEGPAKDYFVEIPFHTTRIEWSVGSIPRDAADAEIGGLYEPIYREIASNVRSLMHMLRGEDAP
jgi:phosphate transport system protein